MEHSNVHIENQLINDPLLQYYLNVKNSQQLVLILQARESGMI